MEGLIEDLKEVSQRRKLLRRRICKFIRENIEEVSSLRFKGLIVRKARMGYLGDFCDDTLIDIVNDIRGGN